jgi:hypothetical protein
MTGSALFDFFIALILLVGAVALFFYAIEGMSPDALFTKIARLAVGLVAVVIFLYAIKAVFFGGGGGVSITPLGVIQFAIGIIVVLLVIYVAKAAISFFLPQFAVPIMYIIGGVALIALLALFAQIFFGGGLSLGSGSGGALNRPLIQQQQQR